MNKGKLKVNIEYDSATAYRMAENEIEDIFTALNSSEYGINSSYITEIQNKYGKNEIEDRKRNIAIKLLLKAIMTPFNGILFILAVVSFVIDVLLNKPESRDWSTVIVISSMVLLSTILRFVQEYNSEKASRALKNMVNNTASVFRDGNTISREINIKELVVGDVIHLSAGDMIPADLRIFESKDIFISQSALTGESDMIEKYKGLLNKKERSAIADLDDICYMGTTVMSGTAKGIIFATGKNTYLGTIAKSIEGKRAQTDFDRGINKVSMLLIKFMLFMTPVVFVINGLTKGDWLEALLFSLSVAVGLTPEMLPMIVTGNLAKGAINMSKRKTIVKNIDSIQNFGAMNILCTDKTGTLTFDKIILERYLDVDGKDSLKVLEKAYYNSFFQTGLKDLMDKAILDHKEELHFEKLHEYCVKIDEIPFDFSRRRMSVIIEDNDKRKSIITKGALEETLMICGLYEQDDRLIKIDSELYGKIKAMGEKLNNQGMRILAVAYKDVETDKSVFSVEDESEMIFIGYLAFLDPPKDSAQKAIAELLKNGVKVKVLSGDTAGVVKTVCNKVGVSTEYTLTGDDIDKLTDEALMGQLDKVDAYAKLAPLQKTRIITLLQKMKNIVGFLGDGINDASALKQSDIGISVDTAVDIAKESADIILLEKDLMVLKDGVIEGRRTFGNIMKYIKMAASSNFGNMLSVLIASAFLPFLPMLPIQILVQNLLYDFSQTSIPFDKVDKEFVSRPQKWDASNLKWFIIDIGPISSIFDICTFLIMWYIFKCNTPAHQALFHTGWFVEGLISQTLIVHMIRTKHIPFIQSTASLHVLITTGLVIAAGIIIPYTYFGQKLGFDILPPQYFIWLILMLLCYCILTQTAKIIYIRHFKRWLA